MSNSTANMPAWLQCLNEEDLAFLKRFIRNSGSLKDTAKAYGISYPTVRLRLDRLLAKIEAVEQSESRSPFERLLRAHYAEGRLDNDTFNDLLRAHLNDPARSKDGDS